MRVGSRLLVLLPRVDRGIAVSGMHAAAAGGTATTPALHIIRSVPRPGHDRIVVERTAECRARRVLPGPARWTVEVDVVPFARRARARVRR